MPGRLPPPPAARLILDSLAAAAMLQCVSTTSLWGRARGARLAVSSMRRKFLLGTALAVALLGLFLYNTNFGELRDALAQASLWPWLLACAIQAITFYVRALRWRLLLGPLGRGIPLSSLNNIAAIGFMLNNFVPRGAGELARSYLLGRGRGVGMSATFATVVLERIFDFLTVLILLAILLAGFELPAAETGLLTAE